MKARVKDLEDVHNKRTYEKYFPSDSSKSHDCQSANLCRPDYPQCCHAVHDMFRYHGSCADSHACSSKIQSMPVDENTRKELYSEIAMLKKTLKLKKGCLVDQNVIALIRQCH